MSRFGKMPVAIPAGVTVTVTEDNVVTVKGKLGTLERKFENCVHITVEDGHVHVSCKEATGKNARKINSRAHSMHGLTRVLIHNMITGVTEGYKKILMIVGVGYKAVKQGKDLQLFLGYSLTPNGQPQKKYIFRDNDQVTYEVPDDAAIKKEGIDQMVKEKINAGLIVVVKGIDKQAVGQAAAVLRAQKSPEPYHGKGVRYIDETVRRKAIKKSTK